MSYHTTRHRRQVIFMRRTKRTMTSPGQPKNPRLDQPEAVDEEFIEGMANLTLRLAAASVIPDLFSRPPLVRDALETETSLAQDETVEACLPFLSGEKEGLDYNDAGVPPLDRKRHVKFLHTN